MHVDPQPKTCSRWVYHTWFKWDDTNANQFFGLFGSEFKLAMNNRVKESEELRTSIRAFLEIGNERNRLVHQDYVVYGMFCWDHRASK